MDALLGVTSDVPRLGGVGLRDKALSPAASVCYKMRMIINYSTAAGAFRGVGGRNRDIA